jgi:hypothetical protein
MSYKSRGSYPVDRCFRGNCIHWETNVCEDCFGHKLYKEYDSKDFVEEIKQEDKGQENEK